MIETESYIDAIKVGLFRKSINNNDFWAKEIQQYRISPDFPFHFKSAIIANTPCGEMSICLRKFCNIFWSMNGNFLDMRIFDIDIAHLESSEKLGTNHFRANLTPETVLLMGIIIATPTTQVLPNHTIMSPFMLNQPFFPN